MSQKGFKAFLSQWGLRQKIYQYHTEKPIANTTKDVLLLGMTGFNI